MPEAQPTLAVAIPAYNEADGIGEFLTELDRELASAAASVTFVVVDDASTDETQAALATVAPKLRARLAISRNPHNSGHGPTTLRAYRLALETGADVILQVDGDGQFDGFDARRLVEQVGTADVVTGVRADRNDPWFRKALAFSLRAYLRSCFRVTTADANCPLRAYRRAPLQHMLAQLPADALVPNVYLSTLAHACGYRVVAIPVRHRARRGRTNEGSTWGHRRLSFLVPRRLMRLVFAALAESAEFRPTVRELRRSASEGAESSVVLGTTASESIGGIGLGG